MVFFSETEKGNSFKETKEKKSRGVEDNEDEEEKRKINHKTKGQKAATNLKCTSLLSCFCETNKMSSLPEKSQPLAAAVAAAAPSIVAASKPTASTPSQSAAATFFLRSDSIRKIKCTAVYPFQVAGVKLNKDAIIELLETNIKKARICTQKTMLNFYYVILKLLSTLFALWDNKVPVKATLKSSTVDETSTSTKQNATKTSAPAASGPVESYQTRLEEKLAKIQKHKSRLNGNRLIPPTFSSDDTAIATTKTPAIQPFSSESSARLSGSQVSSSSEQLRPLSSTASSVPAKSKFEEYCLILCVHAGLVIMYMQVVILGIALNTTNVPSGLIFMLVTVAIIGYIFVKVSLIDRRTASAKFSRSLPLPKAKGGKRTTDTVKGGDSSPDRQSRSKAKKYQSLIELKYKTLSKVKLL